MTNRYKIYPDLKFGVAKIKPGPVSFPDLFDIALDIRKDKDFSKVIYHLTDLRGSTFDFSQDKLSELKNIIEMHEDENKIKTGVYIVNLPNETAYVHMFFDSLSKTRNYCSTVEKAYALLSLPISFQEFEQKINI